MSDPVVPASAVEADPTKPYKAYVAFALTLLGTLWAALEGRDTLDNMTLMEWLSIIIPVILTTGAVYGIRNPKVIDVPPPAGDVPVDERGAVSPALALIVVGAVLALVGLLVAELAWLLWVGVVVAVVGVVLLLVGSSSGRNRL